MVVYEYQNDDQTTLGATPTPVKTTILNNIIYFQAVEDHNSDYALDGKYSVYYGQDYIKYIHATPYFENNKEKYTYIQTSTQTSEMYDGSQNAPVLYDATPSSVDLYQTTLTQKSDGYYKVALFNDGIDWKDLVSQKTGAKAIANFSGPNVRLHVKVGPSYGKMKIRIISKQEKKTDVEEVSVSGIDLDCFSLEEKESIIYQNSNLDYKDYNLEIEVLEDKNILSTGKSIEIVKITFLKNMYVELEGQEINQELVFTSIGGIR